MLLSCKHLLSRPEYAKDFTDKSYGEISLHLVSRQKDSPEHLPNNHQLADLAAEFGLHHPVI